MISIIARAFILIIISLSLISCGSKQDSARLHEISVNLQSASDSRLESGCMDYYRSIESKSEEYASREKAAVWHTAAMKIKRVSDAAFLQLKDLRDKIQLATPRQTVNRIEKYDNGDMKAASKILDDDAKEQFKKALCCGHCLEFW